MSFSFYLFFAIPLYFHFCWKFLEQKCYVCRRCPVTYSKYFDNPLGNNLLQKWPGKELWIFESVQSAHKGARRVLRSRALIGCLQTSEFLNESFDNFCTLCKHLGMCYWKPKESIPKIFTVRTSCICFARVQCIAYYLLLSAFLRLNESSSTLH